VLTHAAPIVSRYKIRPIVFVNGGFAEGGVYYRVLAALLTKYGHTSAYARELVERDPATRWSTDPETLFHQTKNEYRAPGLIEAATGVAYRKCLGDPADLKVHLTSDAVRRLRSLGWEVGNHTLAHFRLSSLDVERIAVAVEENEQYWQRHGAPLLAALAYPNGAAVDVSVPVKRYLDGRPDVQGAFCNGGVNLTASRIEWLRLFAGNNDARTMAARMRGERARTEVALRVLNESDGPL
jgi:peptidoglycan/xylan/chitin deacetylase (PgdA/CDA1 family)